jgi:formylglycine-generating enzyme required for sulfatase activity
LTWLAATSAVLLACSQIAGLGDPPNPTADEGDAGPDSSLVDRPGAGDDAHANDAGVDAEDGSAASADANDTGDASASSEASDAGDAATDRTNEGDAGDAADGEAGDPYRGCPQGAGPMVRIDSPGWSYCIDVTEVTRAAFASYAVSHPPIGPHAPPACKTDAAAAAPPQVPGGQPSNNPVSGVPFCYAWDYCDSVGKRLCGNRGGGHVASKTTSEWYYACIGGAPGTVYPYGNNYDKSACVTEATGPKAAGSLSRCKGRMPPFDLLYDMSGNLAELDDSASSYDGSEGDPLVAARGGWYGSSEPDVACATETDYYMYTNATQAPPELGFRCCADSH